MTKSTGDNWVGVPAQTEILDSGDPPSYKLGRVIRVKRADIDAFLERVKVRPGDLRHLYPPGEYDDPNRKR